MKLNDRVSLPVVLMLERFVDECVVKMCIALFYGGAINS
jgi:hypothetical protein